MSTLSQRRRRLRHPRTPILTLFNAQFVDVMDEVAAQLNINRSEFIRRATLEVVKRTTKLPTAELSP